MLIPLKELLGLDGKKVAVSITNSVLKIVKATGVISIEGEKIFLLTNCYDLQGQTAKDLR